MMDQPGPADRIPIDPIDSAEAAGPLGQLAPMPNSTPLTIEPLILEHHVVIYHYAYRLTGRQQDAEDLTQQTFLVAQQKLDQVREPTKVLGWLFAVLRSCYHKMLRKPFPVSAASLELEVDEIPDTTDEETIDREQLQAALNQLPDEFKLVLLAFYFEERSYQEIAEQLNIPVGTVMSRLSRGKARLRALLLQADSMYVAAGKTETAPTTKSAILFAPSRLPSPGGETLARITHG